MQAGAEEGMKRGDQLKRIIEESKPVYSFFGHSCSTGEILQVPPGCMLVTLAFCGSPTYSDEINAKFDELFSMKDFNYLLLDPLTNKKEIEEYLGVPENTLNINHPNAEREENRSYMNTIYNAQLMHDYEPFRAHDSGLYKFPERVSHNFYDKIIDRFNQDEFVIMMDTVYKEEVIYPKKEDILKELAVLLSNHVPYSRIIEQIGEKFKISQKELFERFPGIYYHVTCRTPCDENAKAAVERRRRASRPWLTEEQLAANKEKFERINRELRSAEETMSELRSQAATNEAMRRARQAIEEEEAAASAAAAEYRGAGAGAAAEYRGAGAAAAEYRGAGAGAAAIGQYGGGRRSKRRRTRRQRRGTKRYRIKR